MESVDTSPLSREGFKTTTFLGIAAFAVLFVLPALSALVMLLFSEGGRIPGAGVFWLLVLKSCVWGFGLATLSSALSIVLAFFPAIYLSFRTRPMPPVVLAPFRSVGFMIFALPSSALALGLLSVIPGSAPSWLGQGFVPVLIAHVFWNVIFLTCVFYEKLRRWQAAGGTGLLEEARALGANPRVLMHRFLLPMLSPEIGFWAGSIFLWSLYSFGTVLILGGSPSSTTPEVLLFYHLFSLYDPSRLLVLLPLTMLVNSIVFSFLRKKIRAFPANVGKSDQAQNACRSPLYSNWWPSLLAPALALLVFILLAGKTIMGLGAANAVSGISESFLRLGHSVTIALLSVFIASGLLFLSVASRPRLHSALALGISFSPSILALAWSQSLSPVVWRVPLAGRIFLTAFLIALSQWPLLDLWVRLRLRQINVELLESAAALGANLRQRIFWLRLPALRDVLLQSLAIVFLGAFGDLLFSGLFLDDWKTLPLWAEECAAHYDFFPSKFFLVATWACLLLIPLVQRTRRSGQVIHA